MPEIDLLVSGDVQDAISAAVVIQLKLPRLPDDNLISKFAYELQDADHQSVNDIISAYNQCGLEAKRVRWLAARIHLSCLWASIYRVSKKSVIQRKSRNYIVTTNCSRHSSSKELKALIVACDSKGWHLYTKALASLSPHTFFELRSAANVAGINLNKLSYILCKKCVRNASELALLDIRKGRPALREMDRAAKSIVLAYKELTGIENSGRVTVAGSSDDIGKPTGNLHKLLIDIGNIYNIKLATESSDDRLRPKRERPRRKK